jgi:hypothetical protein
MSRARASADRMNNPRWPIYKGAKDGKDKEEGEEKREKRTKATRPPRHNVIIFR